MLSKFLGRSEMMKNVAVLVSGTALAQALGLLILPVLTRIYSPEDFAVFSLFSSVVAIIGVIATARYEFAIVLPADDQKAANVFSLCLLISTAVSLFSLLLIFLYDLSPFSTDNKDFSAIFYLAPVSILLTGVNATMNYWSSRKKTFKNNSLSRVLTALITAIVSVVFGWLTLTTTGLIVGMVAGQIIGLLVMFYRIKPMEIIRLISKDGVKEVMKEYKSFPIVNSPHAFIDSFQSNGVVFMLSSYFKSSVVGFYSFAFRLLKAPVGLVGSAFFQVTFQKISQMRNEGQNVHSVIMGIYKKTFLIGFPFFTLLFVFTPEIFSFLFGERWLEAGEMARILIPWIFLNFISSPASCVPLVFGKQKQAFMISILDIVMRFTLLLIGGIMGDYRWSLIGMSISCSLIIIGTLIWYSKVTREE